MESKEPPTREGQRLNQSTVNGMNTGGNRISEIVARQQRFFNLTQHPSNGLLWFAGAAQPIDPKFAGRFKNNRWEAASF